MNWHWHRQWAWQWHSQWPDLTDLTVARPPDANEFITGHVIGWLRYRPGLQNWGFYSIVIRRRYDSSYREMRDLYIRFLLERDSLEFLFSRILFFGPLCYHYHIIPTPRSRWKVGRATESHPSPTFCHRPFFLPRPHSSPGIPRARYKRVSLVPFCFLWSR